MNYTKIRIVFNDYTDLYITEDELVVYQLSEQYHRIDYLNDKDEYHRTDGPAREYADGSKEWWVDNNRHRTDGPAIEDSHGYKSWYINGKRHRTDGPSVEWPDGIKFWFVDGKPCAQEKFERKYGVK